MALLHARHRRLRRCRSSFNSRAPTRPAGSGQLTVFWRIRGLIRYLLR